MTGTETLLIAIGLGLLGAFFGSFAGAQVWRLRLRQLRTETIDFKRIKSLDVADRSADDKEYLQYLQQSATERTAEHKKLSVIDKPVAKDRSRCLHCSHELQAKDLIPLVSWLSTRGRCRYCKQPIGRFEPLMELGLAAYFVGSFLLWPFSLTGTAEIMSLAIWLVAGIILVTAFAYDLKWLMLPDVLTFGFAGLGLLYVATQALIAENPGALIVSALISVAIMSGTYLVLWLVSKGKWVGFGDVKLGLGLGLFIVDWRLAFTALFMANLIGVLVILPGLLSGVLTRKSAVPFGPMLMGGLLVAFFFGTPLLTWYTSLLF
jgi:prepilin signal peptidase PulO-like enzyme (type II secretory pathway)